MSSTRYAAAGSPLRQERFASSFDRGLMANLVAKRCARIASADMRALIWFVQWLSWRPEGLTGLQVKGVERLCLDPRAELSAADMAALVRFRSDWIEERAKAWVRTAVGRRVVDALDYTFSARTISIIDGPSRIGKTFAARAWCEQSAGLARYCQVPSSSDEQTFLRSIAKAVGVSININSKAVELRVRVEEALHSGDLMLVLDEAAFLFPQTWQRYAMPARVDWIMSSLTNFGVPVALVSAPHFYDAQRRVEKLTGWNSAQFIGRIGHVERLPDRLSLADRVQVAEALFPEGDAKVIRRLAIYSEVSEKNLASVEAIIKRARWLASREGRDAATEQDVDKAISEGVIPSDSALAVSLRKRRAPVAGVPQGRGKDSFGVPPGRSAALVVT